MSVFKCKMCGGDLIVHEGDKVVTCDFCDTTQTVISSDDEKIIKQINRGNKLRSSGEFDKAYNIFESLLAEQGSNAEIYWNLLLCKYGITYVKDYDETMKPTINRMSMTSILEDDDYNKVLTTADVVSKEKYIEETKEIARIQNSILDVIKKEEPYDIFISYKETDEYGDRTEDSVIAQDIYDELTKEGYRVFLSRISLSSIAGSDYETYIYQALYTAKAMILVVTNEEYVNSVWVRNEWSRFIAMMRNDKNKNLIPCYREIDPYDLPKEIRNLQGIDMSKLGHIQDLKIGLNKIFGKNGYQNRTFISPFEQQCKNLTIRAIQLYNEDKEKNKEKILQLIEQEQNLDVNYNEMYGLLYIEEFSETFQPRAYWNYEYVDLTNQYYDRIVNIKDSEILELYHEMFINLLKNKLPLYPYLNISYEEHPFLKLEDKVIDESPKLIKSIYFCKHVETKNFPVQNKIRVDAYEEHFVVHDPRDDNNLLYSKYSYVINFGADVSWFDQFNSNSDFTWYSSKPYLHLFMEQLKLIEGYKNGYFDISIDGENRVTVLSKDFKDKVTLKFARCGVSNYEKQRKCIYFKRGLFIGLGVLFSILIIVFIIVAKINRIF